MVAASGGVHWAAPWGGGRHPHSPGRWTLEPAQRLFSLVTTRGQCLPTQRVFLGKEASISPPGQPFPPHCFVTNVHLLL